MTLHMIEANQIPRAGSSVETRILDFLDGDSDGSDLFEALYGHVAREPIPARLRLAALIPANQDELLIAAS